MASSSYYPPKKSPLLAALLGIIPGLGHLYNEQVGKGVFLIAIFIGIPMMAILSMVDVPFLSMGYYHSSVWSGDYHQPPIMSKLFVILAFCVFIPILIVYSMADAAATSAKINRGEIPLGGYPTVTPPPPPHQPGYAQSVNYYPEVNKMNATPISEGAAGTAFAHSGSHAGQTHTSESQASHTNESVNSNETGSAGYEQKTKHGRLVLAIVLIGLGFFSMVDAWDVSYLEFENIWPLIPLFFGLRLLREYQLEHNHSQKVLGIIFTAFGGIFLINNWADINIFELMGDFWYLIPLAIGFFILIKDFKEKKQKKATVKKGE